METKKSIIKAARSEFIEKGFTNASMRNIAAEVGISATALYRHYKNKEEIFDEVVSPAVNTWEKLFISENERQTSTAREDGLEAMWNDFSQCRIIVDIIYENYDEQKLLFCSAQGTKYEEYLHYIVTKVQNYTLDFMNELKEKGISVNTVDKKEMHLLLSAQYSAILEMLRHDFSYEEAQHYMYTVNSFFREGWRSFLGF